jgi:HEAT repeat protein
MMGPKSLLLLLLFFPLFLLSQENRNEAEILRRIYNHITVKDGLSALAEAKEGMKCFPTEKMQDASIEALISAGKINQALDSLKEKMPSRILAETLAWGILKEGARSSQYAIRLNSLVGAFLTHDAKALPFFLAALRDSNAILRAVGVQLSCFYGDYLLEEELLHLFEREKTFFVRMEILRALGKMRIKKMESRLKEIAASDQATFEEKGIAINSLVNIYEKALPEEVGFLTKSPKAGLRKFGCELAAHFEVKEALPQVVKLLEDPRPDVRISALNACGLYYRWDVKKEEIFPLIERSLFDKTPAVAITAAWTAMLLQHPLAEQSFQHWLCHPFEENRRLAAAALANTGSFGVLLAQKKIVETQDPFVAANLALGLLGQRVEVKKCCDILFHFLKTKNGLWMWEEKEGTLFQVLSNSDLHHLDPIPFFPEAADAMATLRLLSFLAVEGDDRALEGLKHFLAHKHWGLSAVAAIALLQEGGEKEAELVRKLLADPDRNIRVQAALALAFLGKDRTALPILIEAYRNADHEMKERILEALGQIGSEESLPFLYKSLQEPFPQLRVIAASSLIQCLYR